MTTKTTTTARQKIKCVRPILQLLGTAACLVNCFALTQFYRLRNTRNVNGTLCLARTSADLLLTLILAAYCPIIAISTIGKRDDKRETPSPGDVCVMSVLLAAWLASLYFQLGLCNFFFAHFNLFVCFIFLVIVVQRHIAICFPFAYSEAFKPQRIVFFLLGLCMLVVVQVGEAHKNFCVT